MRIRVIMAFSLVMFFSVAGCNNSKVEPQNARMTVTSENIIQIAGIQLQLEKMVYHGSEFALEKNKPFVMFKEDGSFAGSASVNRFFGTMLIDEKGVISLSDKMGSTRMMGPENLMKQETIFLNAMSEITMITKSGIRVTAQNDDGTTLLGFYIPVE